MQTVRVKFTITEGWHDGYCTDNKAIETVETTFLLKLDWPDLPLRYVEDLESMTLNKDAVKAYLLTWPKEMDELGSAEGVPESACITCCEPKIEIHSARVIVKD